VSARSYGQFCGFARALEVIGERWALMIVRDLLVAPKRFSDLARGLPGIPSNILTRRLKEFEEAGIVRRAIAPPPERGVVYELTEYGRELEEVVYAIGRWGAKSLDAPRAGETITVDSIVTALRTTFEPKAARDVDATFELRMGPVTVHARVARGTLKAAGGSLDDPDITIEAGPQLKALMAGEIPPAAALKQGIVRVRGDRRLLTTFANIFKIAPMVSRW
jgi:DNA-binding HxlR family transcriptional regulator